MIRPIIAALAAAFLCSCASTPKTIPELRADRLTVMTYNVENLFDTVDNPGKNDETFLPASAKDAKIQNECRYKNSNYYADECLDKDWSPAILDRKLARLTDVLKQVENGRGPDLLFLEEVEDIRVLNQWRDKYLSKMGYQPPILLEGPDERGIDTAILTRLKMVDEPKLHQIDFSKDEKLAYRPQRPTRAILEAHFKLPNGEPLTAFAIHFPSQGASTEHRKVAVETLLDAASKVPAGTHVIVGGDFNITSKEEFKQKYFHDMLGSHFAVSHLVGCKDCAGTIYYHRDRTWSFFDALLFSKDFMNAHSSWTLDTQSIHIVNSSVYQTSPWGTPSRFGSGKGSTGVSDHWPMFAEIRYNAPIIVGEKK